jgi:hypothetical protein
VAIAPNAIAYSMERSSKRRDCLRIEEVQSDRQPRAFAAVPAALDLARVTATSSFSGRCSVSVNVLPRMGQPVGEQAMRLRRRNRDRVPGPGGACGTFFSIARLMPSTCAALAA